MPTTTWGLPLWDDTPNVTPLEEFFNSISNAMDDAATTINTTAQNSGFKQFATKAAMDAAPGTAAGQHAVVTADSTQAHNSDWRWNGSAWVPNRGPFSMYITFFSDGGAIGVDAARNQTVSFPAGKFTQPPIVFVTGNNARFNYSVSGITTTSATISQANWSNATAIPGTAYVMAIQMASGVSNG